MKEQKSRLPITVDENTRWVDCQAGEHELIRIYEVNGVPDTRIQAVADSIQQSVRGDIELNRRELGDLIESGIQVTYVYRNRMGKELLRFTVDPAQQ